MSDPELPVLTLDGFGVAFGRRVILASVDLQLPADGVDVLMGPVKTGKSTLLRALAGLNRGNARFRSWGQVHLKGQPVAAAGELPVLVQQHVAILGGSVAEALSHHRRQREERSRSGWLAHAREVLAQTGLAQDVPDPEVPVLSLPLEWQRAVNILASARLEPALLMVDEPTYGLPAAAADRLIGWLANLGRQQRLLVCLHHQGQARRLATRVLLLAGGRVLAHEPAERFFGPCESPWVQQFVRSGSLPLPSPDADPAELADDVPAPPPLPPAALMAVAAAKAAEAALPLRQELDAIVPPRAQMPLSAPVPAAMPPSAPPDRRQSPRNPARPFAAGASGPDSGGATSAPPAAQPTAAVLPPTSPHGVREAALVGRSILSDYRGPAGFHWILPGRLAGCAEPGIAAPIDYDMDLLQRMGIGVLITLTEYDLDQEALKRHALRNIHLPIFDREAPSVHQAYMLVYRIQKLLDQGQNVAVHCKAGIGRTGTVLAAWMVREGGLSAETAIERLRQINRSYVQTAEQEAFLQRLEDDMTRRL